jgi:hypothetical protein
VLRVTAKWIAEKIKGLQLEPKVTPFTVQSSEDHFEETSSRKEDHYLVELTLEGPRSSGAEAVILTSRFERVSSSAQKPADGASYSWAFMVSFMHMVQHQHWRSKDIVLVLSPDTTGTKGVEFWIDRLNSAKDTAENSLQYRHSFIIASLSVELPPVAKFHTLAVKPEGYLGILPNLDLPNTIFRVAYRRELRYLSWTPSNLVSFTNMPILTQLSEALPGIVTTTRIGEWNTMFSFMLNMAIGEPTGDHSLISKYKIESVTLSAEVAPSTNSAPGSSSATTGLATGTGTGTVKKLGETLEGTLRSLNNLIEPLHQSFYYYIPLTPFTFVPIGHYMISFGLLFVPAALWVLLTLIPAPQENLFDSLNHFAPSAFAGLAAFLLPSLLPSILPIVSDLLWPNSPYNPEFGSVEFAELYLTLIAIISSTTLFLSRIHKLKKFSPKQQPQDNSGLRPKGALDIAACIAFTPYLLFLAGASLVNVSFALLAIVTTLPPLSLALLKRRGPKFLRLLIAIAINPLLLLALYSNFLGAPIVYIVSRAMVNWASYSGLIFPFSCLYFTLSLHAIDLSVRSE